MISHKPNTLNDIPLARRHVLLFTTSRFSCFLFVSLPFWGHIWNMISYSPTLLIYGQTQNNGLIYTVCVYPCKFQVNSVSSSLFLVFLMLQLPLIPSLLFSFLPSFKYHTIKSVCCWIGVVHHIGRIKYSWDKVFIRTYGWITEDILWHWGIHKHGVAVTTWRGNGPAEVYEERTITQSLIMSFDCVMKALLPRRHSSQLNTWQR